MFPPWQIHQAGKRWIQGWLMSTTEDRILYHAKHIKACYSYTGTCMTGRLGGTNSAVAAGACGFVIPTCGCAQSTALGVVRAAPRIIEYRWNPFVWFVSFMWSRYSPSLGPEPKPRVCYIIQWYPLQEVSPWWGKSFCRFNWEKLHFCGPIEIWHLIGSFPNVNSVGASSPADFGLRM